MFIKAILTKNLQEKDIIRVNRSCPAGQQFQVLRVEVGFEDKVVWPFYEPRSAIECSSDEMVGLVYRPWPEGKTEEDMRRAVETLAAQVRPGRENDPELFIKLREAIEDWQLGRSQA